MPAESILVLAGHRQHHVRQWRELLLNAYRQALGGLNIWAFPAWGLRCLERYEFLHSPQGCALLQSRDTIFLMQRFHAQHPEYFVGQWCPQSFYEHLFRRYRRCGENVLDWDALQTRTQALEYDPLAAEANRFLQAFQSWLLQQPQRLLDPYSQMMELAQLADSPQVQAEFKTYRHWIIDDLDETRPIEQLLIEKLSTSAENLVYAGNPEGGAERLMGAHPNYLDDLKQRAEVQYLEFEQPQAGLAQKLRYGFLPDSSEAPAQWPAVKVSHSSHPTEMLEACSQDVLERVQAGVSLDDMLVVSWSLDEMSARQLRAHFEHQGIPVQIYRGGSTLQRHPLINALLTLLRLVRWQELQQRPQIASLTGFDMAQLLLLCGGDAFELAKTRFEWGDRLELWGQHLRQRAAEHPPLEDLQNCLNQLRAQTDLSLFEQAHALWSVLLPALSEVPDADALQAVQSLLQLLERHAQIQRWLFDPENDVLLLQQLLAQSLWDAAPVDLRSKSPCLRIMTLFRLCELGYACQHQFWLNLSSPDWGRPINHPLDNALLLSPAWELSRPWSLAAEEHFIQQRLATLTAKGVLYGQGRAYFYAARYDNSAKAQSFERLIQILEDTSGFTSPRIRNKIEEIAN